MEPYKIIYQQLGGNKFKVMTGAKNLGFGDEGYSLSMKIGKNNKQVTHVKIHLNELDTYDMTFSVIRRHRIVREETVNGVYDDMLQSVFTEQTGLDTHL